MTKKYRKNKFIIEQLEQRLMFSADFEPLPLDGGFHENILVGSSVEEMPLVPSPSEIRITDGKENLRREILFIDKSISDYQKLVDDLLKKNSDGRQVDVVLLDINRNGIIQISETLGRYQDLDAVHVISHGSDGTIQLGNARLTQDSLDSYADAIEGWGTALSSNADLLFYGCNLAAGEEGRELMQSLTFLIDADVAASDDPTGSRQLDGDWILEYRTGTIETGNAISRDVQQSWSHVMAIETVRDEFNTAGTYAGNNGTQSWTGNWQEVGESDGASSGKVRVIGSPAALRIGGAGMISGKGALREVDLSAATSATLSFDAWRSASRAATITLAVSDNGGTDWTNLQTWSFSSLTSSPSLKTFDLTAYMSANTQIRFLGSGEADSADFYADNVQIEYTTGGTTTSIGDAVLADRNVWSGGYHFGVDAFTLKTNSGTDTLTDLTVTFSGTDVNDVAASGVKIWRDDGATANNWDENDTLIDTASFVGNTASFTGLSEAINTSSTQYIITYNIADPATATNILQGSVTAATVSNTLINNDNVDATLTVDVDMVHETSAYKFVYGPGIGNELYLKNTSSPNTNILQGMSIGSLYSGGPASLLMTFDPDATVTTNVNNSAVEQVQMSGRLMDRTGVSYGTVTADMTFYEDRFAFNMNVSVTSNPSGADWLFMSYATWDGVMDTNFLYSGNSNPFSNQTTNYSPNNQTEPISYQTLFEMGATDGLINATLQHDGSFALGGNKFIDNGGSFDVAFQKDISAAPIGNFNSSVMYSFGTTAGVLNSTLAEERRDGYFVPATLDFTIPGNDGINLGYVPERGAYTLQDDDDPGEQDHVKFEFQPTTTHHAPVFEIGNWSTTEPAIITVGGETKVLGTDYNAELSGTTLYLQYLGDISANTIIEIGNDFVSGTVYSDEGTTNIGAGKIVRILLNGASVGTATTDVKGRYSFFTNLAGNDTLLVYVDGDDGATDDGTTVTVTDGDGLAGLDIYTDHLITRHDNAGVMTNTLLDAADGAGGDAEILYSVAGGNLTVSGANTELYVPGSHTFTPGGDVSTHDIEIIGTVTAGANAFTVSGNWDSASGTFTYDMSTVTFNAAATGNTITSGSAKFYDVDFNSATGDWTFLDALTANNNFTVTDTDTGGNGVDFNNQTLNVTGNYTIIAGGVTAGTSTITVGGNWDSSGEEIQYAYWNSSVVLTGTGTVKQRTAGGGWNYLFGSISLGAAGQTTTLTSSNLWTANQFTIGSGTFTDGPSSYTVYLQGVGDVFIDGGGTISVQNLYYRSNSTRGDLNVVGRDYTGIGTLGFYGVGGAPGDNINNMQGNIIANNIRIWENNSTGNLNVLSTNDFSITANSLTIGLNGDPTEYGYINAGASAIDINGNVTIYASDASGTNRINAGSSTWTVSGNWTNNDTFTPGTSTVIFDGGNQSINGSTTFNNFTKVDSTNNATDVTLTFDNTATQTINGILTLDGLDADDRINLVSDNPTNQWSIHLTASATKGTMDYLDVTDSDASGSDISHITIDPANSIDGGNNDCWFNSAPTDISISASDIDENIDTSGGSSIGTLTSTDPDIGETFTYSVVGGADQVNFSIGGAGSDELILTAGILNYEAKSSYEVIVRTTDSGGLTFDKTITGTVNNLNEDPTDVSISASDIDENVDTSGGSSIGTLSSTDPDSGDTFTYTLVGGADQAVFSIGGAGSDELVLTAGILNYEAKASYEVIVRTTDSGGLTFDKTITVTVNDLNEDPTDVAISASDIDENVDTSGGSSIGTLTSTDPDAGDTFTYSVVGGADQGSFSIGGAGSDELILTAGILNYEAKSSYEVIVRTTDSGGLTFDKTITVTVNDLNEDPTDVSISASTIDENVDTSGGSSIGTLSSTDPDSGDTFTYSVVGGADQGNFSIGGAGSDELILTAGILNYEAKSSYEVIVRTTDSGGLTFDKTITVTVNDLNEDPTDVSISASDIDENIDTSGGSSIGTLTSTDPDSGDTFIYSVVGGADQANFSIGGAGSDELVLTAGILNYEAKSSYEVILRTTDSGGLIFDKTITVTVNDLNETPTAISLDNMNVDENTAGAIVGNLSTTDPDAGDTHTYTVDDARFEVVAGQLKLKAGQILDFGTEPSVNIIVTSTDTGGLNTNQAFTITVNKVTAVNKAPRATNMNAGETYTEGTVVDLTDIVVTDADSANITVTLTLSDPAAGTLSTDTSGTVSSTFAGGVWTASGAIDDVNTLLANVTFTPASNYNSTFTIAVSVDDGVAASATGVKEMNFAAGNETPAEPVPGPGDDGDVLPVDLTDDPDSDEVITEDQVEDDAVPQSNPIIFSGKSKSPASDKHSVKSDSLKINTNSDDLVGNRYEGRNPEIETFTLSGVMNDVVEELSDIADNINTSIQVLGDAIESIERHENIITKTVLGGSLTLSAGLATWIFRGGSLVASALSTMPIWKGFDPVHVLPMTGKEKREKVRETRKIEKEERRKNRRITDLFDTSDEQHVKNDKETEKS